MATTLPRATAGDALGVFADVLLPNVAKGVLLRRPKVVAQAEALQLDRRAVRRLQRLRARYGRGPVVLPIPGRPQAVILDPADVRRVLDGTPEPFAAASREKRSAISHFQPDGVLASHGAARADRRRYNDAVLESGCPMHHLGARFAAAVREEAAPLLAGAAGGALAWDPFVVAWWRAVRRVMLGDAVRDDTALTDLLQALRSDANWAFLVLKRLAVRDRFFARLAAHVARAEPGSLAAVMASTPHGPATAAVGQVPQWLFASDATAIATFRALALLAAHPEYAARAWAEADAAPLGAELPLLRAAVLESVRLWPTTPMILRETTRETTWEHGALPAGSGVMIFAPFFHRDDERLPEADRFAPELWLDAAGGGRPVGDGPATAWPLVPFSAGPAFCPGRYVALLLASQMLAALGAGGAPRLASASPLVPGRPLPATLDNYRLRFALEG
jgi:cytochrome P450